MKVKVLLYIHFVLVHVVLRFFVVDVVADDDMLRFLSVDLVVDTVDVAPRS